MGDDEGGCVAVAAAAAVGLDYTSKEPLKPLVHSSAVVAAAGDKAAAAAGAGAGVALAFCPWILSWAEAVAQAALVGLRAW